MATSTYRPLSDLIYDNALSQLGVTSLDNSQKSVMGDGGSFANPYYGLDKAGAVNKYLAGQSPQDWFNQWQSKYYSPGGPDAPVLGPDGQVQIKSYDGNPFGEFITVPAIFAAMIASAGAACGAIGGAAAGGSGLVDGLGAAAAGYGGEAAGTFAGSGLVDGLGAAAEGYGGAAGGSALGGANGGGMWDWLDQIGSNFGNGEADNLVSQAGANSGGWDYNEFLQSIGVDPSSTQFSGGTMSNTDIMNQIMGGSSSLPSGVKDLVQKLISSGNGSSVPGLLKSLFGGSSGGSSGGGILNGLLNDPLGSAFNATPFLLALAQANKQADDLNGVLSQIDGAGYQKAVLDPYDIQTGVGRTALTDSLSQRGVLGSSFGSNDLNNYQYTRDLGRGDLASKASLASAGLQGQLINSRNTNTNMLLGAGLNASGRLFSPQKDPFNLSALLGA